MKPLLRFALPLLAGVAALLLGLWLTLRASLPALDGRLVMPGLGAAVSIERDERGTPTIRAASRADLAFATGYLHAADRYFQMDLGRRLAAGELAELVGAAALEQDRRARLFGLRHVAQAVVATATPQERALLDAYARGVNAGLAGLGSRPWEYWLLRSKPTAWLPEDTVLVSLCMWWQLQYAELDRKRVRHAVERALLAQGSQDPRAALAFLFPRGTQWDAPLPAPGSERARPEDPPVPPPQALDLRLRRSPVGVQIMTAVPPAGRSPIEALAAPERGIGSNAWALSGSRSASGGALVANDMHLGLGVPATWYPARLILAAGESGRDSLELVGLTLPGVPALIAGSNGHLAWGFTNSYGDWLDVTRMRCLPGGGLERPDGVHEAFEHRLETIHVHGGADVRLDVEVAPAGIRLPARDGQPAGAQCDIVSWLAAVPGATNLGILALERAQGVDEALGLAPAIGMPHQNLVVGDAAGHIGWTVIGRVPDDSGAPAFLRNSGLLPWRTAAQLPRVVDPADGQVWSANARAVEGPAEAVLGGDAQGSGAGYDLGARARQIRDDLLSLKGRAGPGDMLATQLDDRALFLARWRAHLLALLDARATRGHFEREEFRRLIEGWDGRADPDSVGYRLVRAFHLELRERAWRVILAALDVRDEAGEPLIEVPPPLQFEGALWRLVTEQPAHLLPLSTESWRVFELEALEATFDELARSCRALASCRYGGAHPVAIRHALSRVLPGVLAGALDMPVVELPGDHDMPRVQEGAFGASERFAVSPGHEADGYLELPGGASGHPLSPSYRAGFAAWAGGRPQPLLPGAPRHRLELLPGAPNPPPTR